MIADLKQDILRRLKRLIDAYFANRKLVILTLVVLAFLFFIWPGWFSWSGRTSVGIYSSSDSYSSSCLENALASHEEKAAVFDASIYRTNNVDDAKHASTNHFLPFLGNGHFGISPVFGKDKRVRLKHGRALSIPIDKLELLTDVSIENYAFADAYVTDYRSGSVTRVMAFNIDGVCLIVDNVIYFHRKFVNVFVQDINIREPAKREIKLQLKRPTPVWKESRTEKIKDFDYHVASTQLPVPGRKEKFYVLSAMFAQVPAILTLKPNQKNHVRLLTALESSEPAAPEVYADNRKIGEQRLLEVLKKVVDIGQQDFYVSHADVWNTLFNSGFAISFSHAPDSLNGDHINATIYNVLSNIGAPLHEDNIPESARSVARDAMINPDRCYQGHTTLMYPTKLWSPMRTVDEIVNTAQYWSITLEKRGGCRSLLDAGIDGFLQAMILSFGEFKFTHHHLEFNTQPRELHRDYLFRKIAFGNGSYCTVAVEVNDENKAILYVSLDYRNKNNKSSKFFACDAGCLDAPIELSAERKQLPVKQTEPSTAILYITTDNEHIAELKHSIHVKEVAMAPAHQHHIIAMHKHGHSLGGLPTLFWVSLAFLVVVFHLFLIRLIYLEYCRDQPTYTSRGKYRLSA